LPKHREIAMPAVIAKAKCQAIAKAYGECPFETLEIVRERDGA
jgi:hypothetical protein